jgi:hydroxymethylpyrimidine/phosphomethylpyrimidine kinase
VALTIAGSDSGGGAGIQADLKTFSALGVFGASAITSITAQNTQGVRGIQAISPEIVEGQIHAVFEDLTVDAVKIGMLHNRIVACSIDRFCPSKIILDPVMISTSGSKLIEDETIEVIVKELFHRVTLITPNIDEAAFLSGMPIRNEEEMEMAAQKLLALGCRSEGKEMADILFTHDEAPLRLAVPTIQTQNTHGTGCTLSSAIAAYMALGKELPDAVRAAKDYITAALRAGADVKTGHGHGPLDHFFDPVPLIKIEV